MTLPPWDWRIPSVALPTAWGEEIRNLQVDSVKMRTWMDALHLTFSLIGRYYIRHLFSKIPRGNSHMRNYIYLSLLSLLILCGCRTQTQRVELSRSFIGNVQYVTIGAVDPGDTLTQNIIRDSLLQIGVPVVMAGSNIYYVKVPEAQYREAIERLQMESRLKGKGLAFM
jgi:hypothetical protein